MEPYPHFMLAEKLIEYIENTEIQNKMRDEAHLKEIDDLKKKLDTINNHYERENKHLQKLLDKDNDRHDAVIQNMNQLV